LSIAARSRMLKASSTNDLINSLFFLPMSTN
jgi:hypothetical protein